MSVPSFFRKHWLATGAYAAVGVGLAATWMNYQDANFEPRTHDRDEARELIDSLPLNAEPKLSYVLENGLDTAPQKRYLAFSDDFNTPALMGLPPKPAQSFLSEFAYQKDDILLNPYLVKALEEDPKAREYVRMIKSVADNHDLDWRLCANQIFRESLHFNHDVIHGLENSPRGAIGIAQFIPAKAIEYGFTSEEMVNPETALSVYGLHMSNLKEQYGGDMILALIAYNGGEGAIDWAREEMKDSEADGKAILDFLEARYNELGNTDPHAYHVETRAYVTEILRTSPDEKDNPEWTVTQNEKFNNPYFIAGLLNESHVLDNMFPIFKPPVVTIADGNGMTSSPRPKERPERIELAQN